jgi:hypothetical protein
MSAVTNNPTPFSPRGLLRSRAGLTRRCENALIVLGICLPVPLLAATGLSLPLPATVERIAAGLVPWMQTATLDENEALAAGANGSIVRAPGEQTAEAAGTSTPSSADNPRPTLSTTDGKGQSGGSTTSSGSGGGQPGSSGSGTGGGSGSDPGSEPPGPTSPIQGTVDQVTGATQPVVDQVEGTVTGVVGPVTGVVEPVGDTVAGTLSGLGK